MLRTFVLITLFGGLTACEKEGANFASLCTEVMSRDAPEGEVRIYNLDESLPDQACSCFAKTTVERNPDDLSLFGNIFYDIKRIQNRETATADEAFDLLVTELRTSDRVPVYGILSSNRGIDQINRLRNDFAYAGRLAARSEDCSL